VNVAVKLWFLYKTGNFLTSRGKGILFLEDIAAPHKAAITHQKLTDLHFEVLKHPTYSPDLAPSDYYLFPNLFIKLKTYQPPSLVEPTGFFACIIQ
jgi:hypothetical protein